MTEPTLPARLSPGAHIRVIAPSCSLALIANGNRALATRRLEGMGFTISFGVNTEKYDDVAASSVASRVEDLHDAFADHSVDGILTVVGGWNCNQLLPHLDWDLIRQHPKVFCGYSDVTALGNAILTQSNLVSYSGPHWSTFGMEKHLDPAITWFEQCLFTSEPLDLAPATHWSDDRWYQDQENRRLEPNDGWWILREGEASGTIVGGNLCTLNLLQGTPYMPSLAGTVLFVEDDRETKPHTFDRDLTSLSQLDDFTESKALLIGRFQRASEMTQDRLADIIGANTRLDGLPVIGNVDFGHTHPLITFPIGGHAVVSAHPQYPAITLDVH